jgi:hypothetical protein
MKSTLVRLLALATLATSMSAFGATEKSKHDDAANTSATTQQNGCPATQKEDQKEEKKQKKAQKAQEKNQQENQEDQDYARFLMGSYG